MVQIDILTVDYLFALIGITLFAAITPGPNNALVATSGLSFGYKRTVPHILGIAFGFGVMIFVVSFALGQLIAQSALIQEILRWIGAAVLIYVAFKIARQGSLGTTEAQLRPFYAYEAALFQWVNPKAWSMALAISSQFTLAQAPIRSATIVALVSVAIGLLSASLWTVFGTQLRRFLSTDERLRWFYRSMGLTLVGFVFVLLLRS